MKEIPEIEFTKEIPKLKPMNLGGYEFLYNPSLGYFPYFSFALRKRVKQKKACNIVCSGESGIGKSYQMADIFRVLAPKYFSVDDIVFRYPEFLRCVLTSVRGLPIEFDEPSYAMSKKDWYKEVTKALVKTIESFRFKGKPLGLPIINKALLEKDIRNYLIQFHIVVHDRGKATCYRTYPSSFKDAVYHYQFCKLQYRMFDNNLCSKDSCLDCRKLDPTEKTKLPCPLFRAKYERKKISTQEERYEISLEEAEQRDIKEYSLDEIQSKAILHFDKYYDKDKDKIDKDLLAVILKRKYRIGIGHNKLYRLSAQIRYDHPELFNEPSTINIEAKKHA